MNNVLQSFQNVLHEHGLVPEEILADGNLHRCPTESKPRKQNGAYIAHLDKPAAHMLMSRLEARRVRQGLCRASTGSMSLKKSGDTKVIQNRGAKKGSRRRNPLPAAGTVSET